ncbi:helix-turn-helix domain-containing protein [Jeongeupia chitinilytica]|uniref:OmpR/PhoB-type domain-containing protein n=1 Tax=Jeongeupia chitinilytica TaxID=1041641 RepID=A0ABQ3GWG9_9NEIS|nr:winged helix-turn-helix domain-containing protein [Jeongeupia chitinilytica]GHD56932.1 hypothetical protein GCM10007350_04850 [Jeongeupia chitinilytica]
MQGVKAVVGIAATETERVLATHLVHPGSGLRIALATGLVSVPLQPNSLQRRFSLDLGGRERALLRALVERNGRTVPRSQLEVLAFTGRKEPATSLRLAIVRLRRVFVRVDVQCSCLQTVYGVGYRFDAGLSGFDIVFESSACVST